LDWRSERRMPRVMREQTKRHIRCAIYTRKSTEEGLDQAFNSLDAQKEACAAYILSQQHEGWSAVDTEYDDGGFSGGTMDRPALMRVLQDVRAGRIDIIVVYKIDRLTRSLADFARIVDALDSSRASFVSVTQSFSTTSSMGRLTLNVLLSFAQFERELTGERIRDKIAASKARGMWMGGVVPLGYDVRRRKLVVNEAEAATVRHIYQRYLALGSVLALQTELAAAGITSKRRASHGTPGGAAPFGRGALYLLLQNRIYLGEICHKGTAYPGQQRGIVQKELFEAVEAQLELNRVGRTAPARPRQPSLLVGLVWDAHGRAMTSNHCVKAQLKRYRYYVSRPPVDKCLPACRVPAGDLEELVIAKLRSFLADKDAVLASSGLARPDAFTTGEVLAAASAEAQALRGNGGMMRSTLTKFIDRVDVHRHRIEVTIRVAPLLRWAEDAASGSAAHLLIIAASLMRAGKQMRFATPGVSAKRQRDPALTKFIVKAWQARVALESSSDTSIAELARSQGYGLRHFRVLLRVSYLAPEIVATVLEGTQPVALTRQRLATLSGLPTEWLAQQRALECQPPSGARVRAH
jgi:site-specific DNA recombinase